MDPAPGIETLETLNIKILWDGSKTKSDHWLLMRRNSQFMIRAI